MELDKNYRIVYDETNVILQFHEIREKTKKIDNSKERYEYIDNFYYPTVKHALKGYINKCLKYSNSMLELICSIEDLELKIDKLELNK